MLFNKENNFCSWLSFSWDMNNNFSTKIKKTTTEKKRDHRSFVFCSNFFPSCRNAYIQSKQSVKKKNLCWFQKGRDSHGFQDRRSIFFFFLSRVFSKSIFLFFFFYKRMRIPINKSEPSSKVRGHWRWIILSAATWCLIVVLASFILSHALQEKAQTSFTNCQMISLVRGNFSMNVSWEFEPTNNLSCSPLFTTWTVCETDACVESEETRFQNNTSYECRVAFLNVCDGGSYIFDWTTKAAFLNRVYFSICILVVCFVAFCAFLLKIGVTRRLLDFDVDGVSFDSLE